MPAWFASLIKHQPSKGKIVPKFKKSHFTVPIILFAPETMFLGVTV